MLADGIYPDWSIFLKTISVPQTAKEKLFAKTQESIRKDVERCFGIIQATWKIIEYPCRIFDVKSMQDIITTCIILHNMRIKHRSSSTVEPFEQSSGTLAGFTSGPPPNVDIGLNDYIDQRDGIKDPRIHFQLRNDIIDHLWEVKGNSIA